MTVIAAAGLAGSIPNVTGQRTRASDVASTIGRYGSPGALVVYCPDQLGPAVDRLLPGGRLTQVSFRAGSTGPATVDWAHYLARVRATDPATFTDRVSASVPTNALWLVWPPDYPVVGAKCTALLSAVEAARPGGHQIFGQHPDGCFEHEFLEYLPPFQ